MKKQKHLSEASKKAAREVFLKDKREQEALKTQERLRRRRENPAHIPYKIPKTVFTCDASKLKSKEGRLLNLPIIIAFLLLSLAAKSQVEHRVEYDIDIRYLDSSWRPLYIKIDSIHPPHYYIEHDTIVFTDGQDSKRPTKPFFYEGRPYRSVVNEVPGFMQPGVLQDGDTLWIFSMWRKKW